MEWTNEDGYRVTTKLRRSMSTDVHWWLSEDTYWALGRPRAIVERSIAESHGVRAVRIRWRVRGVLPDGDRSRQHSPGSAMSTSLARIVARGRAHSWSARAVLHPDIADVKRQVLATADAARAVREVRFRGFSDAERDRWMIRDQAEQLC